MKPRALYQQAKGGTLRRVFALSYPIGVANLSQILLGVGAGLIVLLVLSIGANSLFAVFGGSEAVRAEGAPYLRVLAFAAILAAAKAMFRAVYASMGETSVVMRMTFLVNAINIPLNYVLMFVVGWGATERWRRNANLRSRGMRLHGAVRLETVPEYVRAVPCRAPAPVPVGASTALVDRLA